MLHKIYTEVITRVYDMLNGKSLVITEIHDITIDHSIKDSELSISTYDKEYVQKLKNSNKVDKICKNEECELCHVCGISIFRNSDSESEVKYCPWNGMRIT